MALVDTARSAFRRPRNTTPKMEWGQALRSLRRLLNDKEDTTAVFEIMRALNGDSTAKGYRRLLTTEQGGRIAYRREEFAARLMDDAWLDSLPEGTVGAAYRTFIREEQLSADGLAEVSRIGTREIDEQHPYAWMGRRTRDVHDIWHILSGYHRDALGEACLVGFSYAQTGGLGWALIAAGAAWRARKAKQYPLVKAIWQGHPRGKAGHEPPAGLAIGKRTYRGDDFQPRHDLEAFLADAPFGGIARQPIQHGGGRLARQRQFRRRRGFVFLHARHAAVNLVAVDDGAAFAGDDPGDIGLAGGLGDAAGRFEPAGLARPHRHQQKDRQHDDAGQKGIPGPSRQNRLGHGQPGGGQGDGNGPDGSPAPAAKWQADRRLGEGRTSVHGTHSTGFG